MQFMHSRILFLRGKYMSITTSYIYKKESMALSKQFFFIIRLPIAMSFLGHGLVRIPKLQAFSNWMVQEMEPSGIPSILLIPYSYILPFAEALLGVLLILGYKPRYTIAASIILITTLIFGSSMIENWGAIQAQLVHAICLIFLLWLYEKNERYELK